MKSLILALLVLCVQGVQAAEPIAIKGLASVTGKRFHRVYTYELENGDSFQSSRKLKVKDLRPYNVAHPMRAKICEVGDRWNGTMSAASAGLSAGTSAYALLQLVRLK